MSGTLTGSGWLVDEIGADTGSAGRGTFAQMKAIASPSSGATFLVTNYGRGGSLWRYSSTLTDWFPTAPTKVYENTAIISGVAQAADQLLLAIPCEAGLLANKVFRLLISAGKAGTTDAGGTFSVRMGAAGTTADVAVVSASSFLLAAQRAVGFEAWSRMASVTSQNKLGGSSSISFSGSGSSLALNTATTVANVATQTTYVSLTASMGGAVDAPQLGYVALEIQP